MRFYYYKDNNKKEIRKIDRDNICEDINNKAKQAKQNAQLPSRPEVLVSAFPALCVHCGSSHNAVKMCSVLSHLKDGETEAWRGEGACRKVTQ